MSEPIDARALDVELYFHAHSPAENAEMAALLAIMLATAKAAWAEAREAGDLAAMDVAADEMTDAVQLLGVAADKLADQRRAFSPFADLPRPIILVEGPG